LKLTHGSMPLRMVASEVMASRMKTHANQALISGTPCTTTVLTMAWRLASSYSVELGHSKCLDRNCQVPPMLVTPIGRHATDQTRANGRSTQNAVLTTDRRRPAPQQAHLRHQALFQRPRPRPALFQPHLPAHQAPVTMPSHRRVGISLAEICRAACSAARTTTTLSS